MKLSAPSLWIFLTSTILVILLILANIFSIDVPILSTLALSHPFKVLSVAWLLLFIGILFNV
jgi:hypothetical protein